MQLHPRHTEIVEAIHTPWGVLVREDYFQFPETESNLYMVDSAGRPLWFAERAMAGDAYASPMIRVAENLVCCASWHGFDCYINLQDGRLVNAAFTK